MKQCQIFFEAAKIRYAGTGKSKFPAKFDKGYNNQYRYNTPSYRPELFVMQRSEMEKCVVEISQGL
jgi:hypothetical protein